MQGDVAKMSQQTAIDFFIPLFVPARFLQQMSFTESACAIHMPSRYAQMSLLKVVIINNYKYKLSKSKLKIL
jgi:hypothetical protein